MSEDKPVFLRARQPNLVVCVKTFTHSTLRHYLFHMVDHNGGEHETGACPLSYMGSVGSSFDG